MVVRSRVFMAHAGSGGGGINYKNGVVVVEVAVVVVVVMGRNFTIGGVMLITIIYLLSLSSPSSLFLPVMFFPSTPNHILAP